MPKRPRGSRAVQTLEIAWPQLRERPATCPVQVLLPSLEDDRGVLREILRYSMCITPGKLRFLWFTALGALLLFMGFSLFFGSSEYPIGMVFAYSPFFGMVAFLITSAIAKFSHRPVMRIDVIRILCWTVFGCAEGVREMSVSYYAHYWAQYSPAAHASAAAVMGGCVLVITVVTICFPSRKPPPSGHCVHCGYNLTGNESGVCPECGKGIARAKQFATCHDPHASGS